MDGKTYNKNSLRRIGYELPTIITPDKDLKTIMDFRHNIKFFDKNKIPSKQQIDKILKDSHTYVPHKNNIIGINIKVYGPEYEKDKEELAIATVCGPGRDPYIKPGGKYYGDIDELRDRYNEWKMLQLNNKQNELKIYREKYGLNFNPQVTAPYLLAFSKRNREPTEMQKRLGVKDYVWNTSLSENKAFKWFLGAGIQSYAITLLAAEQGIYASFCRCFEKIPNLYSKCLEDVKQSVNDVIFLGLGYRNYEVKYFVDRNKADPDEYIKWVE